MLLNINIMKKLIPILISLCFLADAYAQNTVRISGGTRLTTSGTVQLVLGGGNFINNGSLTGTTGTLVFAQPVNYSGTGKTQVQNFTIAHSSSIASVLSAPIEITNTANLSFGNFNGNNNLVIRSDISKSANLVISGAPTGKVQGIIAKATSNNGPCPNFADTLSLNISGPLLTYQWQSSRDSVSWSNITGATSISYNTTISNNTFFRCYYGASNSSSFVDTVPGIKIVVDSPKAAIAGVTALVIGNSATLTGTATNGTGTWTSSNPSVLTVNSVGVVSAVSIGTSTVTYTVTNSGGCTSSAALAISVNNGNKPTVVTVNPAAVCAPGTVNLTAAAVTTGSDAGLTFKYYTNASATTLLTTPSAVAASGTYYIVGTNSLGAVSDPVPVTVTINALPGGSITSPGTVLCGTPSSLVLTFTGGTSYAWFRNGVAITGATGSQYTLTTTGVYTATITNAAGCVAAADNSITVTQIQKPVVAFTFNGYCTNIPVTFINSTTGSGTLTYQWSDNAGNSSTATSPIFTYTTAGNRSMKLKATPTACPALADSVTITVPVEIPTPAVRMTPVNVLINEPMDVPARGFGAAYVWSPATGLSDATALTPKARLSADQEYKITIKASSTCITVDTVLVRIYDNRIYVPNVFTPNGDGINDKLFVNMAGVKQLHFFRVFNRYGKMVFETRDATVGWDGTFNNALQPMDTYVWVAQVLDGFGSTTILRGNVTLLR